MVVEDIPCAGLPKEVKVEDTPYEEQKAICLKKIKELNEKKSSTTFYIYNQPDAKLIKELEDKKYYVRYSLNYDKGEYKCLITITNPSFIKEGENEFEQIFEELGGSFGIDKDSITKLINTFCQK
jgi:roadblock/LC7 domain-containing protein